VAEQLEEMDVTSEDKHRARIGMRAFYREAQERREKYGPAPVPYSQEAIQQRRSQAKSKKGNKNDKDFREQTQSAEEKIQEGGPPERKSKEKKNKSSSRSHRRSKNKKDRFRMSPRDQKKQKRRHDCEDYRKDRHIITEEK